MNRLRKFLYVVVPSMAFLMIVGQIIITNELAGASSDIRAIDQEINTLTDQHDVLVQEVASASALTTIAQKAQIAGFVSPTKANVVTLGDTRSVAANLPSQVALPR